MNFTQFETEWSGRRVDYDHVYLFQCVDLILQYIYECYGIAGGVAGNAIDYWNDPSAPLLDKFNKIVGSDAQQGDIVVFNGLPGNDNGHIGIATGNINATDVEILEQNGQTGDGDGGNADTNANDNVPLNDGNQIRTRYIPLSRVAGILRPGTLAGAPIALPYTIESITPKQVKLNKDTHLWNLNYDNFTAINSNPVADAINGTLIRVVAVLHHHIGYDYYLPDVSTANGYNTLDCDEYTPVPIPPPDYQPPAGPMVIPNDATYELIKDVSGYLTSNQAINNTNEQVTVPAGTYFIFNNRFDTVDTTKLLAVNLTKTAGKAGAWINVGDNVETPPEPEQPPAPAVVESDFTTTYEPLPEPLVYVALRDLPVVDLAGTKTVTMPKYSVTSIAGNFTVNGIEYARPKSAADKDMWFGIAWTDATTGLANIELESVVYNSKTTVAERQATKTLTTADKVALVIAHLHNAYLSFVNFLGKIKPETKNKKEQ